MPSVTIEFVRIEQLSPDAAKALAEARDAPFREVWITGNMRVNGADNLFRRKLDKIAELQSVNQPATTVGTGASTPVSGDTVLLTPALQHQMPVPDGTNLEVRFKLEITNPDLLIGAGAATATLTAPFYTTVARVSNTSQYVAVWNIRNNDEPTLVEQSYCDVTGHSTAASRNCTTALGPAINCRSYRPQRSDTLIISGAEYSTPGLNLLNWSAPHNAVYHSNTIPTYSGVRCRARSDITAIILHETAGWGDSAVPADWQAPGGNGQVGAHFKVRTDGSIHHFYDCVHSIAHVPTKSEIAIGIEFTNLTNLETPNATVTPAASALDRTPRELILAWDYPFPEGSHPNRKYTLPLAGQMEAVYQLLKQLLFHFPSVPAVWLSLNPWGLPGFTGTDPHHPGFFLMSDWDTLYEPHNEPGIYSHQNVGRHADGSFQALYTWLRHYGLDPATRQALLPQAAYDAARQLCIDMRANAATQRIAARWYADVTAYLP